MGSNKTIAEESEVSNSNTDYLTPRRTSAAGKSPLDVALMKQTSSKIENRLTDQESLLERDN